MSTPDKPKTIVVDIGAALAALQASPELANMMNTAVLGEVAAKELADAHDLIQSQQAEIAALREIVRECQSALAMVVAPAHITGSSLQGAWATCHAAEVRARTFLSTTEGK